MQELTNGRTAMPTVAAKTNAARAIQQEQAFLMLAMQVPRNERLAVDKILAACQEISLAEAAIYAFPKGTTTVSGPSIRLAENIATHWGRIDSGWSIVDEDDDGAEIYTWAVDLSSLNRATRRFRVPFIRVTRGGTYKLTDPRDRYEMCANQAARRMRACLLQIIPAAVVEDAMEQCKRTMAQGNTKPLAARITNMLKAFTEQFGISQAVIEKRFGHKAEALSETEMVTLRSIFQSLKDGAGKATDFFESDAPSVGAVASEAKPKKPDAVITKQMVAEIKETIFERPSDAEITAAANPSIEKKRSHRRKEATEVSQKKSNTSDGLVSGSDQSAQSTSLDFQFGA